MHGRKNLHNLEEGKNTNEFPQIERKHRRKRLFGGDCERLHYCSSECPESKVFTEEEYKRKEIERKRFLKIKVINLNY